MRQTERGGRDSKAESIRGNSRCKKKKANQNLKEGERKKRKTCKDIERVGIRRDTERETRQIDNYSQTH